MAPPRTFDYELLKQLVREHGDWPYSQYAEVLTADNKQAGRRPPHVKPDTVRRAVWQYREEWEDEGVRIPVRGVVLTDLLPPLGSVAPNHRMSTPLRHLREIAKERRGEHPVTDNEATMCRQALRWEARLRENLEIVDLTENGSVIIRPARKDEIGPDGDLLDLAAWVLPNWRAPSRRPFRGRR